MSASQPKENAQELLAEHHPKVFMVKPFAQTCTENRFSGTRGHRAGSQHSVSRPFSPIAQQVTHQALANVDKATRICRGRGNDQLA